MFDGIVVQDEVRVMMNDHGSVWQQATGNMNVVPIGQR